MRRHGAGCSYRSRPGTWRLRLVAERPFASHRTGGAVPLPRAGTCRRCGGFGLMDDHRICEANIRSLWAAAAADPRGCLGLRPARRRAQWRIPFARP